MNKTKSPAQAGGKDKIKMKTIKLSELKNMARIMAQKEIELNGVYFCLIDGRKTKVIK